MGKGNKHPTFKVGSQSEEDTMLYYQQITEGQPLSVTILKNNCDCSKFRLKSRILNNEEKAQQEREGRKAASVGDYNLKLVGQEPEEGEEDSRQDADDKTINEILPEDVDSGAFVVKTSDNDPVDDDKIFVLEILTVNEGNAVSKLYIWIKDNKKEQAIDFWNNNKIKMQ